MPEEEPVPEPELEPEPEPEEDPKTEEEPVEGPEEEYDGEHEDNNIGEENKNNEEMLITSLPSNESQLARVKFTGKGTEVECKVCLVNYTETDTIIYLPCLHFYHEKCILDWFERLEVKLVSPVCPICLKQTFNY